MNDPTIPSVSTYNDSARITLSIPSTQAKVYNQGYSYNQDGFSYNQPNVNYGGVTNYNQDVMPILADYISVQPTLSFLTDMVKLVIGATQTRNYEQGYSYNQSGLTYNQVGVSYGGVYNYNQDVVPATLTFSDVYSIFVPPSGNSGLLIGILGLTYP